MKKVIGVILIVIGLISLTKVFSPSVPETIGGIIGVSIITFVPAIFLFRSKKKDEEND